METFASIDKMYIYDLHCIIQKSFGWQNENLFQFMEKPYNDG